MPISWSVWTGKQEQPVILPLYGTMLTNPGYVRDVNEDSVAYSLPHFQNAGGGFGFLALVADGMGGHAAGEIASKMAADTILNHFRSLGGSPTKMLAAAFRAANGAIYTFGRENSDFSGMGTTCTVLVVHDGAAYLGHIGDSRAYLFRNGEFRQISDDHSLVAELVRQGRMTPEEAVQSPDRNIILRALGTQKMAKPAIWREGLPLRFGDAFLLCSDGLTDLVSDHAISEIISSLSPYEACEALIAMALKAGGTDNVSVGIFKVGSAPESASAVTMTRPVELPMLKSEPSC